jgi:hypothetical protein
MPGMSSRRGIGSARAAVALIAFFFAVPFFAVPFFAPLLLLLIVSTFPV